MFERDISEEAGIPNLRDGLFCYRKGDKIELQADDYQLEPDGEFDVDKWEARQGVITAPAGRLGWKIAYRIARALIKRGKGIVQPQGVELELPCLVDISFS